MKIEVSVSRKMFLEVDDRIFHTLRDIHATDPNAIATAEQYNEAIAIIEQMTGIPVESPATPEGEYIWGVYAMDGVPIFEC